MTKTQLADFITLHHHEPATCPNDVFPQRTEDAKFEKKRASWWGSLKIVTYWGRKAEGWNLVVYTRTDFITNLGRSSNHILLSTLSIHIITILSFAISKHLSFHAYYINVRQSTLGFILFIKRKEYDVARGFCCSTLNGNFWVHWCQDILDLFFQMYLQFSISQ